MKPEGALRSVTAERAVLGGLMLDPTQIPAIAEILDVGDFHREAHQHLFRLMLDMSEKGQPAEMLAVVEQITRAGREEEMGGIVYVSALPDNVPSTENLSYYANLIREAATSRRLIERLDQALERATEGRGSADEQVEALQHALGELSRQPSQGWRPIYDTVQAEYARIQAADERRGQMSGATTGLHELDRVLCGLQPSDLVVVGARPGAGKTAFGLGVARSVAGIISNPGEAVPRGTAVGFFSLEMSHGQITRRLLCAEARVDGSKINRGTLSSDDWARLLHGADVLGGLPLYIDDTPALTPGQIRARALRLKALDPTLGLVVVDYIGLMGGHAPNRQEAVAAASRALKQLAKELNVPVLALAQLNRGLEGRGDKRPMLSDLRESGAIEQDADVVLFVHREEMHNKESTRKGEADIIVAKHRNGAVGSVVVSFVGELTRFENQVQVGQWERSGGGL